MTPWLSLLATLIAAPMVFAQTPPAPAAPPGAAGRAADRKEKREDRREERQEQREERKDERQDRREERQEQRQEQREEKKDERQDRREERQEDRKERREERREDRQARRKERQEEIRKRWGDIANRPEALAELRVHARRMARLNRARKVADEAGKTEAVARADKLIAREKERHQRAMDQIKAKGGKP